MFSFLILSNLLNIGKNCCELRSEKREVLLVSFSDFAHFVFAIIDANFELDYSKLSFSYSDPEVATIKPNFDIALHGKKGTTKVNVLYKYGNGELKTSFTITVK